MAQKNQTYLDSAAGWLRTIGLLSLLNSLLIVFNAGIHFPVGLTIAEFVMYFTKGMQEGGLNTGIVYAIMIIVTITSSGFYYLMGVLASKGKKWPLTLALIFYVLDAIVSIFIFDLITLGFHVYAIIGIARGYKKMPEITTQAASETAVEPEKKDVIDVEAEKKVNIEEK